MELYGIVDGVKHECYELTIAEVEGPWRKKDPVKWKYGKKIYGCEPEENRKTGRIWTYSPVEGCRRKGRSEWEAERIGREQFDRFKWCAGEELKVICQDLGEGLTVSCVGKWMGVVDVYGNSEYGLEEL